jgi:sugar fermentation stimulation protein A
LLLPGCAVKILQAIGALAILDSGLYIAVFYLPRVQKVRVGKLGQFHLKKGVYFYVGSAQRNRSARLKRHSNKKKSLRWHIDYLSSKARMLGAITIPGPRKHECELAKELSKMFEVPVLGFGASDCRCSGHLFYAPEVSWE